MSTSTTKPSVLFWIIGIVALIWNLLGVSAYLMQAYKTDSFQSMYTPEQLDVINQMPSWATAAFAIAVFGGALASLLLLIKKKLAFYVFVISFIGIIVQFYYNFFIANSMDVYGPGAIVMPVMTIAFAVFLMFYSKKAYQKSWLS